MNQNLETLLTELIASANQSGDHEYWVNVIENNKKFFSDLGLVYNEDTLITFLQGFAVSTRLDESMRVYMMLAFSKSIEAEREAKK